MAGTSLVETGDLERRRPETGRTVLEVGPPVHKLVEKHR